MKKYGLLFFSVCLMMLLPSQAAFGEEILSMRNPAAGEAAADVTAAGKAAAGETAVNDAAAGETDVNEATAKGVAAADTGEAKGQPETGGQAKSNSSEPDPSIEGEWEGDGEDWQYRLADETYLKKSWLFHGGYWYYFSSSGYMQRGLKRIGMKSYYFGANGAMAVGWAYDEDEECWYYADEDGALTKGWLYAGGAWYWFDSKYKMYDQGYRMVDAHKYYFYENGQMAANQYVELNYYDENGLRDKRYDITIQGKRKPTAEEKERITKAMEGIPREWIRKFNESGWEFVFFTDKKYYSAPRTDQGIYYVYHKTDTHYKKLKFANPDTLALAFGEYVAWATGNDSQENVFMADYQQYLMESGMAQSLPSYFDNDSSMLFGNLFENFCKPEVRADMKQLSPSLFQYMTDTLGINTEGRRPDEDDFIEMNDDPGISSNGNGPATDESLKEKKGPAGEAA